MSSLVLVRTATRSQSAWTRKKKVGRLVANTYVYFFGDAVSLELIDCVQAVILLSEGRPGEKVIFT